MEGRKGWEGSSTMAFLMLVSHSINNQRVETSGCVL